ncbi:hypothetical protein EON64_04250 [archaeon]|nr:MAG: hypothetical protein EON64_04250 [archaeon]
MNSALLLSSWGRAVGRKLTRGNRKWKEVEPIKKWNIVRGDLVHVIQGPQTGQQGKVLKIIRSTNRLLIEGINMVRNRSMSTIPNLP